MLRLVLLLATLPLVAWAQPIPVPSDSGATYTALQVTPKPGRRVEILSQRVGPSGTSFAWREVDCRKDQYRYLGEGETREAALRRKNPPLPMTALYEGSISWHVSRFACTTRVSTPSPAKPDDAATRLETQQKLEEQARQAEATRQAALEADQRARLNPERAVTLGTTARRGGFGTVMQASFTINNQNGFAIKDVVVFCEARGNSGTVIQSFDKTLYEAVPARRTLTVRNVNLGIINEQVASYSCEVLAATPL